MCPPHATPMPTGITVQYYQDSVRVQVVKSIPFYSITNIEYIISPCDLSLIIVPLWSSS